MSAEHAKSFIDLVNSDPRLQEEVKKTQGNLVDLAAQMGFTVTQEEVHEELRSRWGVDKPDDDGTRPDCQNSCDP